MWFSVHTSWWVAFIVYNIAVNKWEKWNKRIFSSFPDWLVWQRAVWGIDVINLGFFVVLLGILLSRMLILYSMHWVKYTCFSFNKLVSSLSAYTIFNWWFKWKIIMQRQLLLSVMIASITYFQKIAHYKLAYLHLSDTYTPNPTFESPISTIHVRCKSTCHSQR